MRKIIFIFTCALLAGTSLLAQNMPGDTNTIYKEFRAKLGEFKKLEARPTLPEIEDKTKDLQYTSAEHILNQEYPAPTVKPLAIPPDKEQKPYRFYTKLGFGTPIQPLAEVSFNHSEINKFNFGIKYRHHSGIANKINENQRFAKHQGLLHGTYFLEKGMAIGAHAQYDLNRVHYYGYDNEDTTFAAEDIRQRFSKFSYGAKIYNAKPNKARLSYNAALNFYHLNDIVGSKELGMGATFGLEKVFSEKQLFDFKLALDYVNFNDTAAQQLFVPKTNVSYTISHGIFRAKLGVFMGSDRAKFKILPDVDLSIALFNKKLSIFAGWTGDIRTNSFDRLSTYNPWLMSTLQINNSAYQERYGGIRARFRKFNFEVKAAHRPSNVTPLFVNEAPEYTRFRVIYDSLSIFTISGIFSYEITKGLELTTTAAYHFYTLKNQPYAWHLPNLEGNASLTYSIDKFKAKAEFFTQAGVNYYDEVGDLQILNALYDLSFSAQYNPFEKFGVFLDVNNVLNNRNQRFYRYPQFGFNILGGIVLKF